MRLEEKGIKPAWASLVAPYMETPEDVEDALVSEIKGLLAYAKRNGIPDKELRELFQAALLERQSDEAEGAGEDDDALSDSEIPKAKSLLRLVMDQKHGRPQDRVRINPHGPSSARVNALAGLGAAMIDGLTARIDRRHTPRQGAQFANMTLGQMAAHHCRAHGRSPFNEAEAVRMAMHSTSDFAQVLEGAIGNTVARNMTSIQPALARASHEVEANSYRQTKLLGLSGSGMPQEVREGGEIKHVTIDETGEFKPTPRDFGALFRVSNQAIANDDLDLMGQIAQKMTIGATERLRRALVEPLLANDGSGHLMSDGKTVFHADHGNLSASGGAPGLTTLSAARQALRGQRGQQGEFYAYEPWAIIVPPALETIAQQAVAEINATKTSDTNPFSGALEIIVEVALTDPNAWYLIANPASADGLAHAFLDGGKAPRVESKPGWETLGTEFRRVWALDARFVSWASWYKNSGA
ncbi:phage major capsid protein [Roseicitreum antarcticum]|nr:Mu-like prophage major head subunit gpT family protein [Roseicitreum antarcticum]